MKENRILGYALAGVIAVGGMIGGLGCSSNRIFGERCAGCYEINGVKYDVSAKEGRTKVSAEDNKFSVRNYTSDDLPRDFSHMEFTPLDYSHNTVYIEGDGKTPKGKEIVKNGRKEMTMLEQYAEGRHSSTKPSS